MKNEKIHSNILYSLLLNVILAAAFIIRLTPFYEGADDVIFSQLITDGFYDIYFISSFLSRFIGFVQNLIYPYSAYVIIHLLLAFLAYTAITKVFCDEKGRKVGTVCSVFFVLLFGVNNYLTVSFTRLPALLAVAGFLSIIHYSRQKRWLGGTLTGAAFVIVSSMYRFKIFTMALLIAVAFVFALCVTEYFSKNKDGRRLPDFLKISFEPKRLGAAVLTVAVCLSLNVVSNKMNTSTEELAYYREYGSLRSSIWDYDLPAYSVCPDEYEAIGIDENDLYLIDCGFFDENGATTVENMKAIRAIRDKYTDRSVITVARKLFSKGFSKILSLTPAAIYMLVFSALFIAFLILHNKKSWLPFFAVLLAAVAEYGYLSYRGRVLFRVTVSVWLALTCYLLYEFDFSPAVKFVRAKFKGKGRALIIVCAAVAFAAYGFSAYRVITKNPHLSYYPYKDIAIETNDYVNSNPDKKFEFAYKTSYACGMPNTVSDIFHQKKTDYKANYKTVDCVFYLSPFYNYQLEKFGTDDYYKNLFNDDVYFIVRNSKNFGKNIKDYLQKWHAGDKTVEMKRTKKLDYYTVYKYSLR